MLETGYPFEFYDLEKIQTQVKNLNFKLNLRTGRKNQKFIASNNIKYNLDESVLTIEADEFPISIGCIISHKSVKCTTTTKSLFIIYYLLVLDSICCCLDNEIQGLAMEERRYPTL